MTVVRVAHAGADYDVMVGPLVEAIPRIDALAQGGRLPIVSDRRVFGLHGGLLAGVAIPEPILVPEGESAKDWRTLAGVVADLARLEVKRGTPILAFGGGSVGDVAGLAASMFKRGCPVIHVPTTLLAQADSAIGGKTAIDAEGQKNLVGTFHHPALVVADPALLDTLDPRQVRSGYAEVVKYGLIDDAEFFGWCETSAAALLAGDRSLRQRAIVHCVQAKARFVAADPGDTTGTRALLNFGHTFGHAIEAVSEPILHGEAIAIGMVLAMRFSVELGHCPPTASERVERHLREAGLPTTLGETGASPTAVFNAMQADKKATASGLTLILARGIGQAFVARDIDGSRLAAFLAKQS